MTTLGLHRNFISNQSVIFSQLLRMEFFGNHTRMSVRLTKMRMSKRLKIYLRTLRRRWGITQRELAMLLGLRSGVVISRMETQKRLPTSHALLVLLVLFGVTPEEVFPGLLAEIEDIILNRARELYENLQGNGSRASRVKLDFLESVLSRLEDRRSGV